MKLYRSGQFIRPDLQAHIYSKALLGNLEGLKGMCDEGTKFCAVVKANAYGHGIAETVNILKDQVDFFAVASIYEAIHISQIVDYVPILILEPLSAAGPREHLRLCAEAGFHCVISSPGAVDYISDVLNGTGERVNLHVNVETGMGRCGMDKADALKAVEKIGLSECMKLAGVFTHLATADEEDLSYAYEQLGNFEEFLKAGDIRDRYGDAIIHAANSAATIKIPQSHYDMVRCGISLYGYFSRPMKDAGVELRPVMKLQAPISQIKYLGKGQSVSYGRSFITERDTKAAVIPLGYADGYWRCFSNRAKMVIPEARDAVVPVIGRVCMDQLLVDVTNIEDVEEGQMVTVIDNEPGSPCNAYRLCELAGTICYEILTCVHAHVNRIVH
jgi:alanine racemase